MSNEKENKGVPDVECTSVGPSAASPRPSGSGLSAPVPDATLADDEHKCEGCGRDLHPDNEGRICYYCKA